MDSEKNYQLFWVLTVLILLLFAGAVFFFGKDLPKNQQANFNGPKASSRVYTVFYTSGVFSPTNLQINVGDTVRFLNDSILSIRVVSDPHPEHTDLAGFDSISDISAQGVFSFTFTKRGIFDYHNEKRTEQKGTIIVK
ncbi:MAG: hypothetical protein HY451_01975 [Parcubacteria group bacterium]|nr:hypothetical protein [Parcubacteria group bacterium]